MVKPVSVTLVMVAVQFVVPLTFTRFTMPELPVPSTEVLPFPTAWTSA